ncbi:hypothetical protein JOC34_002874 [Virgibacillus halotolerans]|uniref:hypothetical protein n=1 Tax=Virgibacillus halotolerans TaxID=1071053 RepID=UPI0019600079|nr:hypothetical protein [Virgibacillus halotolerans]MBM7600483.1 hypothetical protein [Virgibacillus halotolerans]
MKELHEMYYAELSERVEETIQAIRRRAYEEGYQHGKDDAKLREISETILTPEKLAKLDQKKRDEIVAKAKSDVYDLLKERQISADEMEFITDQKRRVVVAKIKHLFSGFTLTEGIAKCNPDDCFNVHIGKAIALRRALGLAIPSYYLNAPNPTEVRNYDSVDYKGVIYTITPTSEKDMRYGNNQAQVTSIVALDGEVIDDSRE